MHTIPSASAPVPACKTAGEKPPEGNRETGSGEHPDDGGEQRIVCAQCRNAVTTAAQRTTVDGQHRHVFCNPGGFVFDIGCFARAPGCRGIGRRTTEFTWFPGHDWQVAVCGRCRVQLGWRYFARTGSDFFGLILDRIAESSGE